MIRIINVAYIQLLLRGHPTMDVPMYMACRVYFHGADLGTVIRSSIHADSNQGSSLAFRTSG